MSGPRFAVASDAAKKKTYKQQFLASHGLPPSTSLSFDEVVRLSGMPKKALVEVYRRGIGAWKTNIGSVRLKGTFEKNDDVRRHPRSHRLSKEQWALARVYSFATRSKSDFEGADRYIAEKYGLLGPAVTSAWSERQNRAKIIRPIPNRSR